MGPGRSRPLRRPFRHEQAQIARELRAEDLGALAGPRPRKRPRRRCLGSGTRTRASTSTTPARPSFRALRARIKTLDTAREAAEEAQRRALCARHGLPASPGDSWLVSRKDTALVAALEDDLELRRAEEGLTLVRYARQPTTELLALHERLAEALHEERRVEQGPLRRAGRSASRARNALEGRRGEAGPARSTLGHGRVLADRRRRTAADRARRRPAGRAA